MGQFGWYDDEGDPVADVIVTIERRVMPAKLRKLPTITTGPCKPAKKGCEMIWQTRENRRNERAQRKYMCDHPGEIWQALQRMGRRNKHYRQDFIVVGIALHIARGWRSGGGFPRRLPANFPAGIRKTALRAAQREWDEFDNHEDWADIAARKRAMRRQIRLFTFG